MALKVLIFSLEFPPVVGGAGTYSFELAKSLGKLGAGVTVLTRDYSGDTINVIDSDLKQRGVDVIRKSWVEKLWFIPWRSYLLSHLTSHTYDAVICANWCSHVVASKIPQALLGRYFPVFHGDEIHYYFGRRTLRFSLLSRRSKMRAFLNNATKLISVSGDMAKQIEGYGIPFEHISIVLHGIDDELFFKSNEPRSHSSLWSSLGLSKERFVFFCAARMERGKGHDMLIDACSILKSKGYLFDLLLAGDGSLSGELKAKVSDLGLDDTVRFLGAIDRSQLVYYHHVSDCFVMLSRRQGETFGIVFIEANACGKPCIAGDVGGVPEAVEHGVSGLLADPFDIVDCVNKLESILTSEQLLSQLSCGAFERFQNAFKSDVMAQKTLKVINS